MCENCSVLIQLNAKQPARKFFYYSSSYFYAIFFTHSPLTMGTVTGLIRKPPLWASIPQRGSFDRAQEAGRTRPKRLECVPRTAYQLISLLLSRGQVCSG